MRSSIRILAVSAALLAPAALAPKADAQVRIQFQWGTRDRPLRGQRYETMRALAHEFDGRVRHALDMVGGTAGRSRQERKLLASMNDLARRAERFHERMDAYANSPWEVPPEVQDLRERAVDVNRRFARIPTFQHVADDWQAALDVLNRMLQVMQGYDVPTPREYGYEGDHDRGHGYDQHEHERYRREENGGYGNPGYGNPGYGNGNQSSAEVQRLARQLVTEAQQADDQAGRLESDNPQVGAAAGAIHHVAEEARELLEQTSAGTVDRGRIQELLQDARTADDRVRRSGISQSLNEWDEVLSIVERLDQMTR